MKSPPAVIPGAVISPGLDGHIRAYEISTGKLIWDFDAAKGFPTTNGIPAKGGAMPILEGCEVFIAGSPARNFEFAQKGSLLRRTCY